MSYDGPNYTQIPNLLLDEHLPSMGDTELKVTLVIARQTIGWQKEKDKISVTQLMEKTGLSRQGVLDGINAGIARGTIQREPVSNSFLYSLSVNKVDRSTEETGLPTRPISVYSVDRYESKTVYPVDPQKKDLKETKEKGDQVALPVNPPTPPPSPNGNHRSNHSPERDGLGFGQTNGRTYRQSQVAGETMSEAGRLGVDKPTFVAITNTILARTGKAAMAEHDDAALNEARDITLALVKINPRYRTPEGVAEVFDIWAHNGEFGGSVPHPKQIKEYAAQIAAGVVTRKQKNANGTTTTQPAPSPAALYKAWKLKRYQTDNALAIGIPEATLRAEYEQSMRVH